MRRGDVALIGAALPLAAADALHGHMLFAHRTICRRYTWKGAAHNGRGSI